MLQLWPARWCTGHGSYHGESSPCGWDKLSKTTGVCQIEHAFLIYLTGLQVDQGKFSWDVVGTVIGEYTHIALWLSNRRWKRIRMLCRTLSTEQQPSLKFTVIQLRWTDVLCMSLVVLLRGQVISEGPKVCFQLVFTITFTNSKPYPALVVPP